MRGKRQPDCLKNLADVRRAQRFATDRTSSGRRYRNAASPPSLKLIDV
jgi:hypothetical protein